MGQVEQASPMDLKRKPISGKGGAIIDGRELLNNRHSQMVLAAPVLSLLS